MGLGLFGGALRAVVAALVIRVEQAVEEGKGGGFSLVGLVPIVFLAGTTQIVAIGWELIQIFGAAERLHHLLADLFQFVVGNPHALHHIVHLGQTQRLGAAQAKTFVDRLSVFHSRNVDHGYIFFAF